MKHVFVVLLAGMLIAACNEKKEAATSYTDLFFFNLKGDAQTIEDSLFIVDSAGTVLPDSINYELGEYKDGYLEKYTSKDSSGKNTTYNYYTHYENGLWKSFRTETNGQIIDSGTVKLDSAGKYLSARFTDSAGKTTLYTSLSQNEYGRLTGGKILNEDGSLKSSFVDTFDRHLYIGSTNLDSTGKETSKTTVQLNDKGDPVEETTVTQGKDSATTVVKKYRYDTYDGTGNWTRRTELDKSDKPVKIVNRKIVYAKKE